MGSYEVEKKGHRDESKRLMKRKKETLVNLVETEKTEQFEN